MEHGHHAFTTGMQCVEVPRSNHHRVVHNWRSFILARETEQPSLHLAPAVATRIGAANPNSGERLYVPRVRLLLDSQTGQLVNTGH